MAQVRYDELPVSLLGSPGAMARFRRRRAVSIDPWAVFALLTAATMLLLGLGWLRRLIAELGP